MNPSFHIAVFSKAPVAGSSKTRLIPLLGEEGAAAAQRAMTLRTLDTASAAAPGQVSLWCAGEPHHPFLQECATRFGLACHQQCEGDLGQRMASCLQALLAHHRRVLLIGADCPAFTVAGLRAAAQALAQDARIVFAPAEDGGYVLVGARFDAPLPAQCFHGISWGTAQVMAQTRARMRALGWQPGREWRELATLWDVDTPADYLRAQQARLLE